MVMAEATGAGNFSTDLMMRGRIFVTGGTVNAFWMPTPFAKYLVIMKGSSRAAFQYQISDLFPIYQASDTPYKWKY